MRWRWNRSTLHRRSRGRGRHDCDLGIPKDWEAAVQIGLHADRRPLDTGTISGEHFAVMAGAGLDARTMQDADAGLKDRIGRAAYLWTGAEQLDANPVMATIEVEGREFYRGKMSCVLIGNMSEVFAGIKVFSGSRSDDGLLEIGVITAKSRFNGHARSLE
jgi:diacylglycerol kinase (ATP)